LIEIFLNWPDQSEEEVEQLLNRKNGLKINPTIKTERKKTQ